MKSLAKNLVLELNAYGNELQPQLDRGYNSAEYESLIASNVTELLEDAKYLLDKRADSQVFF